MFSKSVKRTNHVYEKPYYDRNTVQVGSLLLDKVNRGPVTELLSNFVLWVSGSKVLRVNSVGSTPLQTQTHQDNWGFNERITKDGGPFGPLWTLRDKWSFLRFVKNYFVVVVVVVTVHVTEWGH